ncbi:hypothetical protein LVJ94_35440 [Pendulispora rubella]|uniref:Uncharacterized protein n=1 Tax=Pendulispora rubella TaxID=2741070 RepID=A0ABZ2KU37_9BACT
MRSWKPESAEIQIYGELPSFLLDARRAFAKIPKQRIAAAAEIVEALSYMLSDARSAASARYIVDLLKYESTPGDPSELESVLESFRKAMRANDVADMKRKRRAPPE